MAAKVEESTCIFHRLLFRNLLLCSCYVLLHNPENFMNAAAAALHEFMS